MSFRITDGRSPSTVVAPRLPADRKSRAAQRFGRAPRGEDEYYGYRGGLRSDDDDVARLHRDQRPGDWRRPRRAPLARDRAAAPSPPILLVHGITGNALAWAGIADEIAGRAELIAVDLRGRAGSREIEGPWGINRNAADLVWVLDALHLDQVLLAGHSLGAFVAAEAAATSPKRSTRVIAIDGGLGFPLPTGAHPDAVLEAVVGPAVQKLAMTFADAEAYLDFHRVHPAFVGDSTRSSPRTSSATPANCPPAGLSAPAAKRPCRRAANRCSSTTASAPTSMA